MPIKLPKLQLPDKYGMVYLYHIHGKLWMVIYQITTKVRLKEFCKSLHWHHQNRLVLLLDEDTDYGSDLMLCLVLFSPALQDLCSPVCHDVVSQCVCQGNEGLPGEQVSWVTAVCIGTQVSSAPLGRLDNTFCQCSLVGQRQNRHKHTPTHVSYSMHLLASEQCTDLMLTQTDCCTANQALVTAAHMPQSWQIADLTAFNCYLSFA